MSALAPTLQSFFTDRLVRQRQASCHTLAAYRDTMRLPLRFALFQYAALRHPDHAAVIQRVLAIPRNTGELSEKWERRHPCRPEF